MAVKFVTNTTKECKRALVERLQTLHFNVQVETLHMNQQAAPVRRYYGTAVLFFPPSSVFLAVCLDSPGVRGVHVSECCSELAGAEGPAAAAAGGGERAGGLHRWVPAAPAPGWAC